MIRAVKEWTCAMAAALAPGLLGFALMAAACALVWAAGAMVDW